MNKRPGAPNPQTRTTRRGPFALRAIAGAVAIACASGAAANPTAPSVAAGTATFQTLGNTLNVTNSPNAIINWGAFSIGSGETTRFIQQSAASAVLNRVIGNDPSSLLGTLTSNGRVFLINPNGIVVGAGARIDTASFIASTLNMTDANFLNGRLTFEGGGLGVVRNEGTIRASGDIMLVGPRVENAGLIRSDSGSVLLAAGQKLTITSPDSQGVRFEVQAPTDMALNVGAIEARNAVGMFAGTLKHSGDIRAGIATADESGRVVLLAQTDAVVDGNATITASGAKGGNVQVLGNRVGVFGNSVIDTSGGRGGGTILVGGDYQGNNPDVRNAQQTVIGPQASLRADAIESGDGGKVIVWSDRLTQFSGSISARGGALSGDGGFVETSGKESLGLLSGRVDASAPAGRTGTWLLDPKNVVIENGGLTGPLDLAAIANFSTPADTTLSSIAPSVINAALADVVIKAHNDITVADEVLMTNPGIGIELEAGKSITVSKNIQTNNGNVVLTANSVSAGSSFRDTGAASITMDPLAAINAGSATITIAMRAGTGGINKTAGDIVLSNLTGSEISVVHGGLEGGAITRASGTSTLTATTGIHLRSTGPAAKIGTATEPILVSTPRIEAQTLNSDSGQAFANGAGGIFLTAQGNLEIGGVTFYSGTERGVQTINGGDIVIEAGGNLTRFGGNDPQQQAPCGGGGASGGPICANNGNITLKAAQIGAPNSSGGLLYVDTGSTPLFNDDPHGSVTAESTSGGIFLRRRMLPLDISTHSLTVPANQPIELSAPSIVVDGNLNASGSAITFIPDGGVRFAGGTVTGASLAVVGGTITVSNGTNAINAAFSNTGTVTLQGGTLALGGDGTDTGTYTLGASTTLDISGGTRRFDPSSLSLDPTATLMVSGTATLDTPIVLPGLTMAGASVGGATLTNSDPGGTVTILGPLTVASGTNLIIAPFSNTNTVTLDGGTLTLAAGGTDTGTYSLGAGTTLEISGGVRRFEPSLTLTGTGALKLSGAGTLDASIGTLPNLTQTGGDLTRTGGGTVNISGNYQASGGTVTGIDAFTTVNSTVEGTLTLVDTTWNSTGTMTLNGSGRIVLAGAGSVPTGLNNTGTISDVSQSEAPISLGSTTEVNKSFTNAGVFTKEVGSIGEQNIDVPLTNTGTINVADGTLNATAFATNAGTIDVSAQATFGTGGADLANTGTIQGSGTLNLGSGTLTNSGTLRAGSLVSAGALQINGNLILDPSSVVEVKIQAPGAAAGTDYDLITVSGAVTLDGTMNVVHLDSFTPGGGANFTPLAYDSRKGDFATINSPGGFSYTGAPGLTSYTITAGGGGGGGGGSTNTWIGTTGLWEIASNWSLNHAPTAGEDAVIPDVGVAGVSDTITVSAASQAARSVNAAENLTISSGGLTLGPASSVIGGTLTISGGALTANGALSASNLSMSSGTLGGSGTVTVNGIAAWTGGDLSGTGTLVIANGASLNISSNTLRRFFDGYTLDNFGTVTWTDSGNMRAETGANAIINRGTWNAQNNSSLSELGGSVTFTNMAGATLEKSGAGTTSTYNTAFNNDGTVNVASGTLALGSGGTSAGSFTPAAGGTLNFSGGTHTLTNTSSVSGGGDVEFGGGTTSIAGTYALSGATNVTGGTVNFNAAASTAGGSLTGGTLGGSGTLTVTGGTFNWSDGNLSGTGTLAIAAPASLNISLNNFRQLFGGYTLDNSGTVTWTDSGNMRAETGANAIINRGTWNAQNNSSLSELVGSVTFTNMAGATLNKSGAATTSTYNTAFNNNGTINVASGILNATAFAPNAGTIDVAALATFGTGGAELINDGTLQGSGTFNVGAGKITNNGFIRPGTSPGTLTIDGNLVQGLNGTIVIELAGSTSGTFDVLTINGVATLGGKLQVLLDGYTPPVGTPFPIMTYAPGSSGDFLVKDMPAAAFFSLTPAPLGYQMASIAAPSNLPPAITLATLNDTNTSAVVNVQNQPILILIGPDPQPKGEDRKPGVGACS